MLNWHNTLTLKSQAYTCGYCGNSLASNVGYFRSVYEDGSDGPATGAIYICHHCRQPTYFQSTMQVPGIRFGSDVKGIDEATVEKLYGEVRDCFSKNAFTASVLGCRKLLMHIAVAKGAAVGKNFVEYVEYLANNGYVPPDARTWVDHIRKKGNEANHEITIMTQEEASDLISFIEMLLKLIYEFPTTAKKYNKP